MVKSARSENHGNHGFRAFHKMNPKKYYSKMKLNNSTDFWAFLLIKFTVEMVPQTPNPNSFPDVSNLRGCILALVRRGDVARKNDVDALFVSAQRVYPWAGHLLMRLEEIGFRV